MSGPPVASSDPAGNDEEVILRLGDVLRLIPAQYLKPGEHDRMRPIRLSVDELAAQIARGRVSIPLAHLASVCPEIFRTPGDIPPEEELALPLQRLLDQIGLVAKRSPVQNNIPRAQVEQAREEAGRILNAAGANTEASRDPENGPGQPFAMAKALSAAKQFLGFFGRQNESPAPALPTAAEVPAPRPKPENAAIPDGYIALRLKPIFQLLPIEVPEPGFSPPETARGIFPLSLIDPQLAKGHVEVALEELIKAMPEELRSGVRPLPGVQVWIPLDEIFQSLPPTHLYYMPPLDLHAGEPQEPAAPAEPPATAQPNEQPPAEEFPAAEEEMPTAPAESPAPKDAAPEQPAGESPSAPEKAVEVLEEQPAAPVVKAEEPAGKNPTAPEEVPPPAEDDDIAPTAESNPAPPAPSPEPEPAPNPPTEAPASPRAPWMRGFMVPPPVLFSGGRAPQAAEAEPLSEIPVAQTPEAKRTTDFLAGQPGIFAAAAFVQGAIFASADFPRKPDLETLRDVIGAFVEKGEESARQLGWTGLLTIACEQFFVTAAVRDSHFVVALHHDRVLPPLSQEALVGAAEEFGRTDAAGKDEPAP